MSAFVNLAAVGTMATPAASRGDDFELGSCFSMSRKQRLYAFAVCFVLGFLMTLLGSLFLLTLNIVGYAMMWTFGNILSLVSTMFLMGPMTQLKRMFDKTRIWATLIYLVMMILTLVIALTLKNFLLCMIFAILQYLAGAWYAISYIPFARDGVKACFGGLL